MSPKRCLFVLLFLYCLVRIPLLLSPLEDISYEIYRGAIAHDLIHGLKLPFWDYTADTYGLGALVAGLWTVPFFKIFGETWFALKFAPFFWHFFSLIAWYFVWKSFYSPIKAFFISLFLVLPPPLMVEYSLSNNGYHFEMILWMALSIILFRKILENGGPASRLGYVSPKKGPLAPPSRLSPPFSNVFLLGLLGGFSSCLILTNLVTVAAIWIYVAILRNVPFRKSVFFGVYALAFLIGFSPWILFNWFYGWPAIPFALSLFAQKGPFWDLFKNVPYFLGHALLPLFGFRKWPSSISLSLSILYGGGFILSLLYLVWYRFKSLFEKVQGLNIEAFGLLYQVLLMGVVTFSMGRSFPHYLYPMVPFVGMTLVFALERMGRKSQIAIASLFIGLGILGHMSLMQWDAMGQTLSMPGYSKYDSLNFNLESNFGHNFELFREKSRRLLKNENSDFKKSFYDSLSKDVFRIHSDNDLKNALSYIQEEEPQFQSILYDRLGIALGFYYQFDPITLKGFFRDFAVPNTMQTHVYLGFIQGLNWTDYPKEIRSAKARLICETIPKEKQSFCAEGIRRLDP